MPNPFEMQFAPMCDYLIVNDRIEPAANELLSAVSTSVGGARCAISFGSPPTSVGARAPYCAAAQRLMTIGGHCPRRLFGAEKALRTPSVDWHLSWVWPDFDREARDVPEKQPGPETYHLSNMDTAPSMLLIYVCEVATAETQPLASGSVWQPVAAPSAV